MKDPTREELIEAVAKFEYFCELTDFEIEEAIFWFAHYWHGGQWSNLYSVLSTSEFRPGRYAKGPEPGYMAQSLCIYLEQTFNEL